MRFYEAQNCSRVLAAGSGGFIQQLLAPVTPPTSLDSIASEKGFTPISEFNRAFGGMDFANLTPFL
ncbi:MAG TPA: hypothetical protein QGG93_02760 [Verrucomicrobiota bacterium]|nr:hypothetical protein [Verrucomicrobiota bacterium]